MGRRCQKNFAPLCAEPMGGTARSELIKLIRHRLHEPLGPTLLVLQLLLREESLSPQGVALIRMLQRGIKDEVRAIQELLTGNRYRSGGNSADDHHFNFAGMHRNLSKISLTRVVLSGAPRAASLFNMAAM